jgi:hypothetical protein
LVPKREVEIFDSEIDMSLANLEEGSSNQKKDLNRNAAWLTSWIEGGTEPQDDEEPELEEQTDLMISYKDSKIEYEEIERNVEVTLHSWKLFKQIHKSADLSTKIYQRSLSPVLNCD